MTRTLLFVSFVAIAQAAYPDYEGHEQSAAGRGYRGPPVVPVILPGGFIADTEEVAKAKDLHFNAYAQVASAAKESGYEEPKYTYTSQAAYSPPQQPKYISQPAYTQQEYSAPRRQQDYNVPRPQYTGPVSQHDDDGSYHQAKPVLSYQQPAYSSQPRYTGPPVIPVILPNGYIAETADVEAAKEHHFQLVAKAQAAVARAQERAKSYGYTPPASYSQQQENEYDAPQQNYNQVYRATPAVAATPAPRQQYKGPPVVPVILPDGHIADTAEVAAAKINHLQQLLDAAQKSQPQQHRYPVSR